MSQPTFSVVIPVYNGANTIARAIESVIAQSYPAREIIVVDDGSTDATVKKLVKFGDIVTYVRQENAGVAAARNNGAGLARSEWLAFLDADDCYYPDRLRWHAEWIERDAELDFLTGNYEYRRADGSFIDYSMQQTTVGRSLLHEAGGNAEIVMQGKQIGQFVASHFGDTHTLSLPRKTFFELGGYPVGRKICEDVHLLIRLCAGSRRVGVICEPMGVYFLHDNSATRANPLQAQFNNVETLRLLKAQSVQFPEAIRQGVLTRLRHARLNLAYSLLNTGKRVSAIKAVLPSLSESPGLASLHDLGSVLRGPRKKLHG